MALRRPSPPRCPSPPNTTTNLRRPSPPPRLAPLLAFSTLSLAAAGAAYLTADNLEETLRRSRDSVGRVVVRMQHTLAAARVLSKSLLPVLSSAKQVMLSGFEMRVDALLANITPPSSPRVAAPSSTGCLTASCPPPRRRPRLLGRWRTRCLTPGRARRSRASSRHSLPPPVHLLVPYQPTRGERVGPLISVAVIVTIYSLGTTISGAPVRTASKLLPLKFECRVRAVRPVYLVVHGANLAKHVD
ncbi:unnamed protein product [Urochloa humidicola]